MFRHSTNLLSLQKFHNLVELHVLGAKLTVESLFKLVNTNPNLTTVSLSLLMVDLKGYHKRNLDFSGFNRIRTAILEFKVSTHQLFIDVVNALDSVANLEIYFTEKYSKYNFNLREFANQFKSLTRLVFGTRNIHLQLVESKEEIKLLKLLSQLSMFKLNFNESLMRGHVISQQILHLVSALKFTQVDINFNLFLSSQMNTLFGLFETHDLAMYRLPPLYASFLHSVVFNTNKLPCICMGLPRQFFQSSTLTAIDLSNLHIHSTESICEMLSGLTSKPTIY
jgi:hypothetical protein